MTPEQEAGNENHIVAIHKPIPFELTGQELAEAKSCGITSPISDLMTLVGRPGDGKPFLWGHWVSGPEQKFAGGSIPAPFFAFGIAA
jgi:hypothetical protein